MKEEVKTVTGIAEKYLGEVERYREVYRENPKVISYRLPPSAQASIDLLSDRGIKLPSVEALNSKLESVDTEIGKALGNLIRDADTTIKKSGVEKQIKQGSTLLKSLDWLL